MYSQSSAPGSKQIDAVDSVPFEAAVHNLPAPSDNSKLNFTREIVVSHGRTHAEARCNQCGFRVRGALGSSFDFEEQEHAFSCGGPKQE